MATDEQRPRTGHEQQELERPDGKSANQGKKLSTASTASIKKIKVLKQPQKKQASGAVSGTEKPAEVQQYNQSIPEAQEPEGHSQLKIQYLEREGRNQQNQITQL